MAFLDIVREFDGRAAFSIVIAFIPYVDAEILGVIPGLRDILPVDPIYTTDLSWTERARLAVLMLIPYVDGEILELLGIDVNQVISDT